MNDKHKKLIEDDAVALHDIVRDVQNKLWIDHDQALKLVELAVIERLTSAVHDVEISIDALDH